MAQQINVSIEINGQPISPFSRLNISQRIDWHHHFELVIPLDALEGTSRNALNQAKDFISKEVVISMKPQIFARQEKNIFKGLITEVSMARHQRGHREVILRGQSPTILLDGAMHCRCFYEMSLSDIVTQLLENVAANTLETKISPTYTRTFPYFVQYKESSFHCLNRAAAMYGEWCFYNGTELVFGKLEKDKKVDLPMDRDLFDFGFSLKLIPLNFTVAAYNYPNKENYESASSAATVNDLEQYGEFSLQKSNEFFKQEARYESSQIIQDAGMLEELVERKKNTLAREMIVASGISDNPYINVGTIVNITGERDSEEDYGEYIVTHVSHSTDGMGNYQNHFEAIPAEATFPPPNANVRAITPDFQTGLVTNNQDPENLGRIKAKLPWQNNDETPWMRIVNQYAGDERGFYFIPEVDDEVLVGFDHGNINHPYVIGSLYNGLDKPDVSQDQKNTIKTIKTRTGNQILFIDDDGKEEIKIQNKDAANEISLSLEGNGKISIKTKGDLEVIADGKMEFTAKQSITLKADQNISFQAGSNTEIKANSKFEIKAADVSIEGTASSKMKSAQTTVEGSGKVEVKGAMASVNGSGITEVKGALVKIN